MRYKILLIFTSILFSACTKSNTQNETIIVTDTTAILTHEDSILIAKKDSVKNIKVNHEFSVKFKDFEVILDSLQVWDGEKRAYSDTRNIPINTDTAFIDVDLGYNFEGNTFTVKLMNNELANIKVQQSCEVSMYLQGVSEKDDEDDPSLDLFSSKKYQLSWKNLKQQSSGKYVTIEYSDAEINLIHKITEEDVHGEIMRLDKEKYNFWVKFLNPDYPFADVKIDYYFLKITGLNKKTGKLFSKIIAIEIPFGC
jgi:hypothetical protein